LKAEKIGSKELPDHIHAILLDSTLLQLKATVIDRNIDSNPKKGFQRGKQALKTLTHPQ